VRKTTRSSACPPLPRPPAFPDGARRYASGLILHAGAKTDSGFLIVNPWPSKEGSEAAARDPRRVGVIERAEISPDQIRREHHEVAHFVVYDECGAWDCFDHEG
jgi:hypothetical protein